jgi:hypothetical protein
MIFMIWWKLDEEQVHEPTTMCVFRMFQVQADAGASFQAHRGRNIQHVRVLPELQHGRLQQISGSVSTQHQNSFFEARLNQC